MTQNNERELFETDDGKWDGVIRAFWRRIQGYQKCEFNDIKDLPDPLPVEFRAHFATALLNAPKELRTPISQNEYSKQIPDGWKPIETVHKDGTQVIIKCSGGRVATAFYDDKPFVGEGWHVVVPFLGGFGSGTDTFIYFPEDMPTHWMPLPTPTMSLTSETNNEVIERIATALENAEGELKTLPEYVSLVRALKVTP